jgi:hypothetical protein
MKKSGFFFFTKKKRSGSGPRASSPTYTSFSGKSSYPSDLYKPLIDKASVSPPPLEPHPLEPHPLKPYPLEPYPSEPHPLELHPLEPHLVARAYYDELSKYLVSYLAQGCVPSPPHASSLTPLVPSAPANSRSSARQKLTRLTRQQFEELSRDVYDELIRRKNYSYTNQGAVIVFFRTPLHHISHFTLVPFLPVRDEFPPKRNQARQKLATLPTSRFQDLSSDVYYELARRYPEFKGEACSICPPSLQPPLSYLIQLSDAASPGPTSDNSTIPWKWGDVVSQPEQTGAPRCPND